MEIDYAKEAKEVRKMVLTLVHKGQTSHIASCLSAVDIAVVLYNNLKPDDRVVWSAGWKAALIYTMLNKQGILTDEDLNIFPNAPYFGLAETTVNGVEVNGGSVGHGLSVAVGMALGKKRAGEKGTVYCIMSDGEVNEGSVWEAVMLASHHKLNNLVAIIDKNGWQAMGKTEDVVNVNVTRAFNGFDCEVITGDGHIFDEIEPSLLTSNRGLPRVFIANTVKGKGVSFMENHLLYHYKDVDEANYKKAMEELCQN